VKKLIPLIVIAAAFVAGCGDDNGPEVESASPAVHRSGSVESRILDACGSHNGVQSFAMATQVSGYGSSTDYWLVLCEDGAVARVEV